MNDAVQSLDILLSFQINRYFYRLFKINFLIVRRTSLNFQVNIQPVAHNNQHYHYQDYYDYTRFPDQCHVLIVCKCFGYNVYGAVP